MATVSRTSWRIWRIDAAGAAICVVMALLVCALGIAPTLSRHSEFAVKRTQLAAQRKQADGLEGALMAIRTQLAEAQEAIAASPLHLQSARQINQRIAQLLVLAVKGKLKVNDIRVGRTTATGRHQMVPIGLDGSGAYRDCVQFLQTLNKTLPDTGVCGFDLSGNPANPSAGATFRFDLVWYTTPKLTSAKKP